MNAADIMMAIQAPAFQTSVMNDIDSAAITIRRSVSVAGAVNARHHRMGESTARAG